MSLPLGVLGFSAGSHLSAHVSNDFSSRSYDRIDEADDLSCRPDFTMLLYPWCVIGSSANWHYGSNCQAATHEIIDHLNPSLDPLISSNPIFCT